jgi:hypothetical protein
MIVGFEFGTEEIRIFKGLQKKTSRKEIGNYFFLSILDGGEGVGKVSPVYVLLAFPTCRALCR